MSRTLVVTPLRFLPMATPLRPAATAAGRVARSLLLATLPQGGQQTARRNAWSAMSADAGLARARRESQVAMARAEMRQPVPVSALVAHAH